jgi:hypothetical protein
LDRFEYMKKKVLCQGKSTTRYDGVLFLRWSPSPAISFGS